MNAEDSEKLWEFPCEISFKVMAVNREGIHLEIAEVIHVHAPNDYSPTSKLSRDGNYISLSYQVKLHSKSQVDAIYRDVFTVEGVKMTL